MSKKVDPVARARVAHFLDELAAVFEKYPEMRLTYTTDDDGVWVDGPKICTYEVNLGFEGENIAVSARAHANWIRSKL